MKKEFKPIAMKCTEEQFNAIEPILEANGGRIASIQSFNLTPYLVNNLDSIQMCISNVSDSRIRKNGRTVFEEWNQDTFLEYCGIEKQTEKTMGYKLTVPATEVLTIHKIASNEWKNIIAKYLTRVDLEQNITFTEKEIDDMFFAATADQKKLLKIIFGEKKKEIDFDKLKTGSKVMLEHSDEHFMFDDSKPVEIVLINTPYYITPDGKFGEVGLDKKFLTFYQDGNFIMFRSDMGMDYITEVIEY